MLFAEGYARALLVFHVLIALALVAVSTHLCIWLRGYPRGKYTRLRAVRRFGMISASLFVLTFLIGNIIYPVYKVRVRMEYLGSGGALLRDYEQREKEKLRLRDQYDALRAAHNNRDIPDKPSKPKLSAQTLSNLPMRGAKIARWFDIKEHVAALGLIMSLACMMILLVWDPKKHGGAISSVVFTMAVFAAASAWFGALVGIVVSSYRSIGGL